MCVTAAIGNVNLDGLTSSAVRTVGTSGLGSMGAISLAGSSRITVRARFRSAIIRGGSSFVTIEQSIIGGTSAARVYDQLIFMPDNTSDVTIRDNDIGWTLADNSGNTGYGCRCYGTNTRLRFERNKVHDIAADGFQGVGGADVVIDRNEIGPVGANPGSSEHSDNIQITGNGSNLRITNNWLHHQGYYNGSTVGNAGATYIHGGGGGAITYENNLVQTAQGRVEIGGLGTGGTSRSAITVRRNTFTDLGRAFTGFPGFEWDIDGGSGNVVERNVAIDPDGGFAQSGSLSAAAVQQTTSGRARRSTRAATASAPPATRPARRPSASAARAACTGRTVSPAAAAQAAAGARGDARHARAMPLARTTVTHHPTKRKSPRAIPSGSWAPPEVRSASRTGPSSLTASRCVAPAALAPAADRAALTVARASASVLARSGPVATKPISGDSSAVVGVTR